VTITTWKVRTRRSTSAILLLAAASFYQLPVGRCFASEDVPKPQPPLRPTSNKDCSDYKAALDKYAQRALDTANSCRGAHLKERLISFMPECGSMMITATAACQEAKSRSWCAYEHVSDALKVCRQEVAEKQVLNAEFQKNDERRLEILKEQCAKDSILPKSDACNSLHSGTGYPEINNK
jgi:DNA-directed RNA polymerase subunit M/transcription elongation factor TFIIS